MSFEELQDDDVEGNIFCELSSIAGIGDLGAGNLFLPLCFLDRASTDVAKNGRL